MTTQVGLVTHVYTLPAQSFATADAAISDTVIYVADGTVFNTDVYPGSVLLADGSVVDYDANDDTSLTLSAPLAVAVDDGTPVQVSPAREIKWAEVTFGAIDDWSDTVTCTIPQNSKWFSFLQPGIYDQGSQPQVIVEMSGQPHLVDAPNQQAEFSASDVPIIISSPDGESARLDGDGLTFTTDDPVLLWAVSDPATATSVAIANGFVYYVNSASDIVQRAAIDGSNETGAAFITGTFKAVAAAPAGSGSSNTNVYVIDSADDITNYFEGAAGSTKTGTFLKIAATDSWLFAMVGTGGSAVLHKYANDFAMTEVTTGGWPKTIGSTVDALAAYGDWVYALVGSATTLHKYAISDGTEDTTGDWALTPVLGALAADGDWVYISGSRYAVADATVDTWTPPELSVPATAWAVGGGLVVGDDGSPNLLAGSTGDVPVASWRVAATTGAQWSALGNDRPWTKLTAASGWTANTGTNTPMVKRVGNVVTMRGGLFGGTGGTTATNLPSWATPTNHVRVATVDATPAPARCRITNAGAVQPAVSLHGEQQMSWNVDN